MHVEKHLHEVKRKKKKEISTTEILEMLDEILCSMLDERTETFELNWPDHVQD